MCSVYVAEWPERTPPVLRCQNCCRSVTSTPVQRMPSTPGSLRVVQGTSLCQPVLRPLLATTSWCRGTTKLVPLPTSDLLPVHCRQVSLHLSCRQQPPLLRKHVSLSLDDFIVAFQCVHRFLTASQHDYYRLFSAIHVGSRWIIQDRRHIINTDNTQTKHNPVQEAKLSLGQPTVLPHSRLSSNWHLLLNSISSCFQDFGP